MTKPADIAAITTDALLAGNTAALPALAAEVAEQFETTLVAMVARIQANHDADIAHRGPYWPRTVYSIDKRRKGQRFIRILRTTDGQRGCVGFVEVGTGLLYKCATMKAPALNFTRGCMFNLPENWAVGTFVAPSFG